MEPEMKLSILKSLKSTDFFNVVELIGNAWDFNWWLDIYILIMQ